MKLTILLSLLLANQLLSQEQPVLDNRLIVYGEGSVEAPADRARMSFVIIGFGPNIQDAMGSARTKLESVVSKLKSIGLTENDLLTSSFYSGDNALGKAFLSSSRDFRTQMDVLISLDSLDWIDNVIKLLVSNDVERLSNVSFSLKNDSLMKVEARDRAVLDGHEKARRMAAQLGVQLTRLVFLEEVFGLPFRTIGNVYRNTTNTVRVEQSGVTFYGAQKFESRSYVKLVFEIK